jgi:hypothetical protein
MRREKCRRKNDREKPTQKAREVVCPRTIALGSPGVGIGRGGGVIDLHCARHCEANPACYSMYEGLFIWQREDGLEYPDKSNSAITMGW